MTYSQIWNTIEDMFRENSNLAKEANEFFGVEELDEILTKDGLSIRFRKLTNSYEVSFNSPLKMVSFLIKKFGNTSYQRSEYELIIKGYVSIMGNGNSHIDDASKIEGLSMGGSTHMVEGIAKEMSFFTRYVRDWKLKNILK